MRIARFNVVGRPLFWAVLMTALLPLVAGAATISTIATIAGANDGSSPAKGIIKFDGKYYGTTAGGGKYGYGTFYRIDLKTGVDTVLHSFNGSVDGQSPSDLLVSGGKIYGSTIYGGSQGSGTIFEIDPTTGAERVIFDKPTQTYVPVSVDYKGLLYGAGQCTYGATCIYSFDPVAGTGQILLIP